MYERRFNYKITKKNILDASKKSKKVGRTYSGDLQQSCKNCFFKILSEEINIPVSFKYTYIREYFTYNYGVDFKNIASHCDEVEQNSLKKLLSKLNKRVAKV